jgi:hypothetical protein
MLALGLIGAADAADCAVGGRGIVDALMSSAAVATALIPTFPAEQAAGATEIFADGATRPLPAYGCPPDKQEALRTFVGGLSTAATADLVPYVSAVFLAPPGDPALAEATAAAGRWRHDVDALVNAVTSAFPARPDAEPFAVDPLPALSSEPGDLPVSARYTIETRWVGAALEPWAHAKSTGEALFAGTPGGPAGAAATIAADCVRIEALPPLDGSTDARDRLAAGCRAWEALARAREATTKRGKIRKLAESAAARASGDAADRAPVDAITARWAGAGEALAAWRRAVQGQGAAWMQRRIEEDHLMEEITP